MPSLFNSFGRGTASPGPDANSSGSTAANQIPRRENRLTPPLSLVRAEVQPVEAGSRTFVGQLWDISLSGASISLGRIVFPHPAESPIILHLRSRHSPEHIALPAIIRWVDINHGVTFTGVSLREKIQQGTFLDAFLDFSQDLGFDYQPKSA